MIGIVLTATMKTGITVLSNQIRASSNQEIIGSDCNVMITGCINADTALEKCIVKPIMMPVVRARIKPTNARSRVRPKDE
jgi:uncharacterized metal-binding protein